MYEEECYDFILSQIPSRNRRIQLRVLYPRLSLIPSTESYTAFHVAKKTGTVNHFKNLMGNPRSRILLDFLKFCEDNPDESYFSYFFRIKNISGDYNHYVLHNLYEFRHQNQEQTLCHFRKLNLFLELRNSFVNMLLRIPTWAKANGKPPLNPIDLFDENELRRYRYDQRIRVAKRILKKFLPIRAINKLDPYDLFSLAEHYRHVLEKGD